MVVITKSWYIWVQSSLLQPAKIFSVSELRKLVSRNFTSRPFIWRRSQVTAAGELGWGIKVSVMVMVGVRMKWKSVVRWDVVKRKVANPCNCSFAENGKFYDFSVPLRISHLSGVIRPIGSFDPIIGRLGQTIWRSISSCFFSQYTMKSWLVAMQSQRSDK